MPTDKLIEWGFMGLVGGSLAFAVRFLSSIAKSVNRLNVQVGVIIERTMNHGKAIENHETRLSAIERKGHRG